MRWTEADGEILPYWLTARDWPWLRDLLAEARAFHGLPVRQLEARWRQSDGDPRAGQGLAMARHVLLGLLRAASPRPALPGMARRSVFLDVAAGLPPETALRQTAERLRVPAADLRAWLFADLPGERRLCWPDPDVGPAHFALIANRALAQGLLLTAESATLLLRGAARAVLRTAWLHGCDLRVVAIDEQGARLRWRAGADAMARRRRRALAATLPVLPWSAQFELRAHCRPRDRHLRLVLTGSDPILPGAEPRPFDSALEERFARGFATVAPHWELLREPSPAIVGGELVFPDFELRRRADGACCLLEIAGLRSADALAGKLRALAALPTLVLCLPRRSLPAELATHPRVIPFARRVDVALVLQRIEALCRE